jgi:hypothetical protein
VRKLSSAAYWARYERCPRCKASAGEGCYDLRSNTTYQQLAGYLPTRKGKPCAGRPRRQEGTQ